MRNISVKFVEKINTRKFCFKFFFFQNSYLFGENEKKMVD